MKIPPWRFFNSKLITRDQIQMLDDLNAQFNKRKAQKDQKDKIEADRNNFANQALKQFQPSTSQRANKTISVL